nr:trihelix transcription factor GT-2-like [Coffea arabica]
MGENHQQQPVFSANQSHQYNHQQPYIFQETQNFQTIPDFFHYHHHFQALLQQQRRLQDQLQQCVLGQENVVSTSATTAAVAGNNIRPSVSFFPLNFKPPDLNENITSSKNGGLDDDGSEDDLFRRNSAAAAALAMASPHYCWQNQEDSATAIRQPFWKPLCTNISDGNNNSQDKEVRLEMHQNKYYKSSEDTEQMNSSLENSKNRLFGELESICRSASVASEANKTGGASAGNLATTTSTCLPITLDKHNTNAGATAAAAAIGHCHDGSESISGHEAPVAVVSKNMKRKKLKDELSSMAIFFEGLVHQLMDHQEALHSNFMNAIERLDKERREREDAWRRQELEKLEQDMATRARERALASSREASIVSYLEKITGQSIKLPPRNHPSDFQPAMISSGAMNGELSPSTSKVCRDHLSINMTSRRWPKAEVEALIQIRSSLEQKFQRPGIKGPLWEQISNSMASMGFQRSAKRCKEKWENINKYFKKSRENAKQCRKKFKTCQYFDQLDQLHSKSQLANGGSYSCSSSSEHQAKPNNENQLPNPIEGLVPARNFRQGEFYCIPSMNVSEEEEEEEGEDGNVDYPDEGD